jgi:hypothetical protein
MTIYADSQPHAWGFMVAEPAGEFSREAITILAGSGAARPLTTGMVLGKRVTGTAAATAGAGNTGDGAMGAITVSGAARRGRYKLLFLEPAADAGTFALFDPDGVLVLKGNVAVAFSAGGLAFTLADGPANFVAGDSFTIDVQVSAEKWLQLDVAATTGEAVAAGILGDDITAADAVDNAGGAALVRGPAIVQAGELVWPAGISDANKANALLELSRLGIIARS